MFETFLYSLPLNDLLRRLNESLDKLLSLSKLPYSKFEFAAKEKEVELIQKVITAKRAELPQIN
jgi:hypothetical protein